MYARRARALLGAFTERCLRRTEVRQPASYRAAVPVELRSVRPSECRLLVAPDEQMEPDCDDGCIHEHAGVTEEQSLTDDHRRHSYVHRIAQVPVETADHELLRRNRWHQRAPTDTDEADDRLAEHREPERHEHDADSAQRAEAEERLPEPPARDHPRD